MYDVIVYLIKTDTRPCMSGQLSRMVSYMIMKYLSSVVVVVTAVVFIGCGVTQSGDSFLDPSNAEKIPLNFSYITTITGGVTGFVSSGSIPMVDLALEQINNRTDILSNYTLNYTTILNSNVSLQESMHAYT